MTDLLPAPAVPATPNAPAGSAALLAAALPVLRAAGAGWLTSGRPTVVAGAPGRLDVMGGIADYSGAVVLEGTIGDLAVIALQRRGDGRLRVRTAGPETGRLPVREVEIAAGAFRAPDGSLRSYEAVREAFPAEARWAAYVLGVFYVLAAEGEIPAGAAGAAGAPGAEGTPGAGATPDGAPGGVLGGADVLLYSTVPLGAGVASSAAVEVATMRAVGAAYGAPTAGLRLASLCQMVENRVVGAPCGIMDQVTCTLGQAGRPLALRCQPHDVLGWPAPPPWLTFAGLDSGVKHAVGGRRYGRVRCAAFMGRQIIREHLRAAGEDPGRVTYLCDLTPADYRAHFRDLLPRRLAVRDFRERWGETGDTATAVDPDEIYPVRGATEHPIYENARVVRFIARLGGDGGQVEGPGRAERARGAEERAAMARAAGRLMYGAHRSYSRNCGLGSPETDQLVALVRRAGPDSGLYGAKITGGGSGGTVAVLLEAGPDGAPSARAAGALGAVADRYAEATGRRPRQIVGSYPGAERIEPLILKW
jgi:galactokinase